MLSIILPAKNEARALADVLPRVNSEMPMAELGSKPVQDRFPTGVADAETDAQAGKQTKTAEALAPTGSAATPAAAAPK